MRYLTLVGGLLLCSCVTDDQGYLRVHGRTNPDHLRLTAELLRCRRRRRWPDWLTDGAGGPGSNCHVSLYG